MASLSNELQGIWHQFVGEFKHELSKLSHDSEAGVDARREKLIGELQERYGYTYEQAESALSAFINQHYTHEPGVERVKTDRLPDPIGHQP